MKGKTPAPRKPPRPTTEALDAAVMATLGGTVAARRYQPPAPRPPAWPSAPVVTKFVPPPETTPTPPTLPSITAAPPAPAAPPATVAPPPAPVTQPAERDGRPRRRLLGEILLDEGHITRAQLGAALQAQADKPGTPLGQLLVALGALTQQDLSAVLDRYNRKYRLGDLLVETNAITEEQLETALAQQKATGLRLGDVLLQLNYVGERELRQALAKQLRVRFADLDEIALDAGLARVIDADYARMHGVVPIGRAGDRLTVAMDDPADSGTVEALTATTGCQIEVVTGTVAALGRAFARVYGEELDEDAPGSAGEPSVAALEARQADTARELAALRVAHERLRRDLETSARLLQSLELRAAETAATLARLTPSGRRA